MEQSSGDIRYQLAKVLGSDVFSTSPTAGRLLEYLVNETLAGRAERLKGYSIGVDVFDRGQDFDASADSIVRVQMGRLRKHLIEYYESAEGKTDQLVFELPKGSYVPQFLRQDEANGKSGAGLVGFSKVAQKRIKYFWIAVLLFAGAIGISAYFFRDQIFVHPERNEPRLFVSQFNAIDGSADTKLIVKGLQHDLIALLSQYPNIEILGYETVAGEGGGKKITEWHGADYLLSGSVATGNGNIKVSSELISVRNGVVLWSNRENFDYADIGDVLQSQSDIALKVGSVLGQPDGVIQQASKALILESEGVSFSNYACILDAYDYKRLKQSDEHRKIRNCLEKATTENPKYSSAWSMLSWIYGDELRYGFNIRPKTAPSTRALKAAEKGVSTNPFSATAHQYLGIAQFYARQDEKARRSMETAMRLSPNNSEILADAGWQMALLGESDESRRFFDEAIRLNPDPPSWYWGGLAIDAIGNADADRADQFVKLYSGDGLLSLYTKVALLRLQGNISEADQLLKTAAQSYPGADRADNSFVRRNRLGTQFTRWVFGTE